MRTWVLIGILLLCCEGGISYSDSRFFREHWAEWDSSISNHTGRLLRVNDPDLSLHENFGKRLEALCNGFTLMNVPEDLFGLRSQEVRGGRWQWCRFP